MVIDGAAFSPFAPMASSLKFGGYSVWLDTMETDGDSKPPILKPAAFAKLNSAVDAMKSAEIALVQQGVDIVRMTVPLEKRVEFRDGLGPWAKRLNPNVGASTYCAGLGFVVN